MRPRGALPRTLEATRMTSEKTASVVCSGGAARRPATRFGPRDVRRLRRRRRPRRRDADRAGLAARRGGAAGGEGRAKRFFVRLLELIALYFLVGLVARLLESRIGSVFPQ